MFLSKIRDFRVQAVMISIKSRRRYGLTRWVTQEAVNRRTCRARSDRKFEEKIQANSKTVVNGHRDRLSSVCLSVCRFFIKSQSWIVAAQKAAEQLNGVDREGLAFLDCFGAATFYRTLFKLGIGNVYESNSFFFIVLFIDFGLERWILESSLYGFFFLYRSLFHNLRSLHIF